MKLTQKMIQSATVILYAGFCVSAFAAEEKERIISMDQVPSKVTDTLKQYAAATDVKAIEKGNEDGKVVFEFSIEQSTNKFEVAISSKGKYMGREQDVEFSSLPDVIQK